MIYLMELLLVGAMPIKLIKIYSKIDDEVKDKLKLSTRNIITIAVISVAYVILTHLITDYSTERYINTALLTGYLIFMSYTDQKTKLLYSVESYIMMFIEILSLLINWSNTCINSYSWTVIIVLIIILVLSLFRCIGFGDFLIYCVIALYSLQYNLLPAWNIIINIFIANLLFLLVTSIIKIIKRDTEKHSPLTIYIAISTFICNSFLL